MWILYGYPPTNKIPREPHGIQRLQSMLQLPQWILLVVIIVVVVVVLMVVILVVMIVEVVVILVVRRDAGTKHKRLNQEKPPHTHVLLVMVLSPISNLETQHETPTRN